MSILNALRAGVKVADKITKPVQPSVTFERDLGTDAYGTKAYGTVVSLRAIVDWRQKQVRTPTGILSVSRASVMFLDIAALVAATGGTGISDNDKITLPDGTTGPILDLSGFIDAGTGQPLATEVFLG